MGIFNKVLHHLSRSKTEEDKVSQNTKNRLLEQVNQYAPLIRLQDERKLIEVIIPGHMDSFQSMIVGVDLYNQQLILDDLTPKLQNREALIGESVVLRHQHKQQMLNISSDVLSWDGESQCFHLKLPEIVHYQPRRQTPRLFLSGKTPLSATIDPIYGAPWYASVSNISTGGMRILVMGDLRNQLHKHKPLKKCDINLNNNSPLISCRGRVKSFSYQGRPYRHTEISISFESISDEYLDALDEFIEQLSISA